ncbi:MAG: long-chain fatty acid--CoA ligase [Cyanobacteria bacterium NC_groundwater_1444_Ag_S-0.65um_54_12]|nr:long-chain fatty acid--CoA ligase [Cyanobacteria bacterium NC_groundwater_1444_Ag_S-0.65um_54_12]
MSPSLSHCFDRTVTRYGSKTALTFKSKGAWQPITYQQFAQQTELVSAALGGLGIEKGDRIALLSENRPEWLMADQGILAIGAVNVPIYPTLASAQIKYLLEDCGARVLLLSSQTHLDKVLPVAGELPQLTHIILFDGTPRGQAPQKLLEWPHFLDQGKEFLASTASERAQRKASLNTDDLASIIYTSGTTGNPKGAMLSHGNLVSNHAEVVELIGITVTDSCLSFLPLSHVLERIAYYSMVSVGATINFAEGVDQVAANLQEVRPTILVSVPRLFEKIRARVYDAMEQAGGLKAKLFYWGLEVTKAAALEREKVGSVPLVLGLKHKIADRLVFSKVRARTGGNLRYCICGGAPLSREVAEFFTLIGIVLLEGYGMTETSPVISCNTPQARRLGTVGKPIPSVKVEIAGDGEILCHGPNVMKGYFNLPEATAEAIDAKGWMHTGDIGEFDPDGFLKITDRKKEILVMSNGKNVAPAPIENTLITSPYIAQAMVIGDNRNFIAALIVPNFEAVERWAKTTGLTVIRPELVKDTRVKALLRSEIDRLMGNFAHFEKIKEFVILPQELSQENGELTPTLKYKRRAILERYQEQIAEIYASIAPVGV